MTEKCPRCGSLRYVRHDDWAPLECADCNYPYPAKKEPASMKLPSEVTVNESGGKQCATAYRMDLLPPDALLEVAAILKAGAEKYGENNWKNIPIADHINHALIHIQGHLKGDTQEPHMRHAACRILFALQLVVEAEQREESGRRWTEYAKAVNKAVDEIEARTGVRRKPKGGAK